MGSSFIASRSPRKITMSVVMSYTLLLVAGTSAFAPAVPTVVHTRRAAVHTRQPMQMRSPAAPSDAAALAAAVLAFGAAQSASAARSGGRVGGRVGGGGGYRGGGGGGGYGGGGYRGGGGVTNVYMAPRPFFSPFGFSPFGFSPFGFGMGFGVPSTPTGHARAAPSALLRPAAIPTLPSCDPHSAKLRSRPCSAKLQACQHRCSCSPSVGWR